VSGVDDGLRRLQFRKKTRAPTDDVNPSLIPTYMTGPILMTVRILAFEKELCCVGNLLFVESKK